MEPRYFWCWGGSGSGSACSVSKAERSGERGAYESSGSSMLMARRHTETYRRSEGALAWPLSYTESRLRGYAEAMIRRSTQ